MQPKIIAVDFDGTLCESAWPKIGRPYMGVVDYILRQQKRGHKIILWTCRTGMLLDEAVRWCENLGIIFDAVNENLPEIYEKMSGYSRKIVADYYIDDRNRLVSSFKTREDRIGDGVWKLIKETDTQYIYAHKNDKCKKMIIDKVAVAEGA